jgi:hypothetical protein
MALWGNTDLLTDAGTIGIAYTNGLVTGAGTTFVTAGVSAGDVITVGTGATFGYAIVESVTDATTLTIVNTDNLVDPAADVPAGATYFISQEPLYVLGDSHYRAPESKDVGFSTSPVFTGVFGVDEIELGVANAASGDGRKYASPHTGWVGITTYIDCHGELRVKHEVLVAGGILTTSDAPDDTQFPDV